MTRSEALAMIPPDVLCSDDATLTAWLADALNRRAVEERLIRTGTHAHLNVSHKALYCIVPHAVDYLPIYLRAFAREPEYGLE